MYSNATARLVTKPGIGAGIVTVDPAFEGEGHLNDVRGFEAQVHFLGEQSDHQLERAVQVREPQPLVAQLDETEEGHEIGRVGRDRSDDARPADFDHDLGAIGEGCFVDLRHRRGCHRPAIP